MNINLYDFDKTIYDGDSSVDFFVFCLSRNYKIALNIPRMIWGVILYKLHIIDKTKMKEKLFHYLKYVKNVDKELKEFWASHEIYIKDFYKEKKHDNDVIISASPEFLLKPITDKLGVKLMLASPVNKKTGKFNGLNCHDIEKVRRLNEVYSKYKVLESYSDSLKSDYPILKLAKKAYLVKGEKLALIDLKKED